MAQPTQAIRRLDLSMTYLEFSLRANRRKFGGLKLLPPLIVGNLSQSEFPRINLKSLLANVSKSDKRAPFAAYSRDTFTWDSDTYTLKDHGVEEIVDDQLIEMYGDIIDAEFIATMRAIDQVIRRLEVDIAAETFTSAYPYKAAASGGVWTDYENATPIEDIFAAINAVEDRTGCTPNKLALTDKSWRDLRQCAQILDRLSLGGNDNPEAVTKNGFLSLFDELDEIIVLGGFSNNANIAQTPVVGRVWNSTMAMLACVSNGPINENDLTDVTPHLGRTLFHQSATDAPGSLMGAEDAEQAVVVEEYREEQRRGGVVRARNWRQIKFLHKECAHLITGIRV
jgi:hypothetical protein